MGTAAAHRQGNSMEGYERVQIREDHRKARWMTVDSQTGTRPDVDLADGSFYAGDSRSAYAWMRTNEPVFRDRNGLAGAASYRAVIEAERQPELFSSAGGIRPEHVPTVPQMIDMDDPGHLRRRKLVNAGFTRKRVQNLGASIGELCDALIDAVCDRGQCDFVWDLAAPLPMAVIGDMLGVRPEDRALLLKWSDDLVSNLSSHLTAEHQQIIMDAFVAYHGYTTKLIGERRSEPTDDLISALVHAVIDGERLSDDDIIMDVLLILVGGDETTRHTLSGGTEQLLRHPDQWEALRADPERLLPGAVEEMLRWTSPVKNMCRTVTADTVFHGTELKQGEKIMLLFESADFDDQQFPDPEKFDITRHPNNHVAFGFGSHFCLGNQLARLELTAMTRRLLERLPDLQLASGNPLPLRPANFVSGLEKMPVVFTPSEPLH
jgi:cholest-4-en-3-one 26-monooxygenase